MIIFKLLKGRKETLADVYPKISLDVRNGDGKPDTCTKSTCALKK